jgi:hypothetical protein
VQVLHVTDVSAMGYVAEEYKYTSASGLVSENKELVPGTAPFVLQPQSSSKFVFSSHFFCRDQNFIRPVPPVGHQQPPPPFFPSLRCSGVLTLTNFKKKTSEL